MSYLSGILSAFAGGGGGILGGIGASKSNKKIPSIPELPGYSGRTPPSPERLRDVESLIDEILMRRSQGMDVGFDPARLTQLKGIYDINAQQDKERATEDFNNQLSGIGQSRNLAARNALLGRYATEAGRERNKYFMGLDVEDLTRRNEERDVNTARLQDDSWRKFAQENTGADFDFNKYKQDIANILATRGMQMENLDRYQDPLGTGIETGLSTLGAVGGFNQGNALSSYLRTLSTQSPTISTAPESRVAQRFTSERPGYYYNSVPSLYRGGRYNT